MHEKKSLSDILRAGNGGGWINKNWSDVPIAPEYGPIPSGQYVAHLKEVEPFNAKTGTPGVKLHFEIVEGDFKGRRLWYDIWLTEAAKSQAVRDFQKLGITSQAQLEQPIPRWIRCQLRVAVNRSDGGAEYNRVKTFDVLGIDAPEADPFATDDALPEGGQAS